MVLISLSPRRIRNYLLVFTACLGLTSMNGFAQPIFFEVASAPYDRQMARVQPVLASVGGFSLEGVSLPIVNGWMNQLRAMRYGYSRQWKTIEATKVADCKGKALTLYEKMQLNGATNVRFVIGRHHAGDSFTHAWIEWDTANGTYVLDPTFSRVVEPAPHDSRKYIPLFAYEGALKYRAIDATLFAQN